MIFGKERSNRKESCNSRDRFLVNLIMRANVLEKAEGVLAIGRLLRPIALSRSEGIKFKRKSSGKVAALELRSETPH